MTPIDLINAEAHRHMRDRVAETALEYAEKFADTRDQLIKEGWTQPLDEAELLRVAIWEAHEVTAQAELIRAALAKARAHPADVVEAAKWLLANSQLDSRSNIVASYILK